MATTMAKKTQQEAMSFQSRVIRRPISASVQVENRIQLRKERLIVVSFYS
jgi:hypothetical protein